MTNKDWFQLSELLWKAAETDRRFQDAAKIALEKAHEGRAE